MSETAEIRREKPVGVVPSGTPAPEGVGRFHIILIKPSKYDDDGYVMRYLRGVLPSNTLATLSALSEEVAERGELGAVRLEITAVDEVVERVDVKAIARRITRPGARGVVALCGVQTNQFPRAADLAREFRAAGLPVMIGGFHVSGAIGMSRNGMPPECQALLDEGVTLVKGEVEECWGDLLRDALHGSLRPFYDVVDKPDLSRARLPVIEPRLMRRYAYPFMGTVDAGRGCPYRCSFCTIVNVQGRTMRGRHPSMIQDRIRRNAELGIDYYFFTDDNFARNPQWEAILDGLIALRREEGIEVTFMMQVDVLAYRIPKFVAKAAEAGCTQVFVGLETINPANLAAAGKSQNRVEDYGNMVEAWHARGIACHVGYIIGFPHDTPESVREDVRRLRDEVQVDQASFFVLMPLPGSQDHADMVRRGEWMDGDYNRFDSFQPVTRHPRMSAKEWSRAFEDAWDDFYSTDGMKSVLSRANSRTYWGLFKNLLWYTYSTRVERTHPMICGFFRVKHRRDRRPGFSVEPFWTHARRRMRETARWLRLVGRLYFEMQEVWLATRGRAQFQEHVDGWRRRYEDAREWLGDSTSRAGQALGRQVAGVRANATQALLKAGEVRRQAAEELSTRIVRARRRGQAGTLAWRRAVRRLNLFAIRTPTRAHLDAYWRQTGDKLRRGRIHRINPVRLLVNLLRDARICMRFNLSILSGYGK